MVTSNKIKNMDADKKANWSYNFLQNDLAKYGRLLSLKGLMKDFNK